MNVSIFHGMKNKILQIYIHSISYIYKYLLKISLEHVLLFIKIGYIYIYLILY